MYKSRIVLLFGISIFLLGMGSVRGAAREELYKLAPFSDYQPILDRMPFGPMPAGVNPDGTPVGGENAQMQTPAEVQVEQQQLARQVKMSCVNISPDGETMIGFTDLSGKPQKNYYIAVGESSDGWSIEDADYDEEWARLKKDGVEITVQLGKGLIDPSQMKGGRSVASSAPQSRPEQAVPYSSRIPSLRGSSLRDRLLSRRRTILGGGQSASTAHSSTSLLGGSPNQSYTERLKERKRQKTEAQAAKEKAAKEQLFKLAREAAAAEMTRQKEEEEVAAQEEFSQDQ